MKQDSTVGFLPCLGQSRDVVNLDQVTKSYSSIFSRKRAVVLDNVNLTIPSGTVFGLLGPSGCGKTTLLKCVVGRLKPGKGSVKVFGYTPGTPESGIPGSRIGYMPQDVALTGELSVNETLKFFGRITGMKSKHINCRMQFLLKLLQMETYQKITINNLSGGQKRRVSFAVALLHEPEILVLDEPTVGVDPLLRQNIWKHLYSVASTSGVTIILTTHYIEEARMAHNVGLMLNGKLLIQSPPDELIRHFGCSTLEEAFVNVCLMEEEELKGADAVAESSLSKTDYVENSVLRDIVDEAAKCSNKYNRMNGKMSVESWHQNCRFFSFDRLLALTIKTFVFTTRHPASMILQLVVTPLIFGVFALSIGKAPFGIEVAVVNHDNSELSHYYIDSINKHSLNLVSYPSYEEAIRAIEQGLVFGAMYLNPNFTDSVLSRFSHSVLVDDISVLESKIQVALDSSNKQVALTISHEIMDTFHKFANRLLSRMGLNPGLADLPIQYYQGSEDALGIEIDQFLIPGFMISIIFFMAMGTTGINHISDKLSGCSDRLRVSGISDFELIIAQLISQTIVLLLLVPLEFIAVFLVLGFKYQGSLFLAGILNLLQGICGLSLGLVTASASDQLTTAMVMCLAFFFVAIMLQGVMWPLESLPIIFRSVSACLPSTHSVLAMRSIVNHSCGLNCAQVILGLSSSCIWIVVFITISWVILRARS